MKWIRSFMEGEAALLLMAGFRSGGSGLLLCRLAARLDQLGHGVRRARAHRQPVGEARLVEADLHRRGVGVVDADVLDEATVARRARVGRDDAVEGALLASLAGEPEVHGHWFSLPPNAARRRE